MREFVYGTDAQFAQLERMLEDNLCHVFPNCIMPEGCNVTVARIGFEKETRTNGYAVHIDKGISFNGRRAPRLFFQWIRTGTVRFIDFDDIKVFFRSLKGIV